MPLKVWGLQIRRAVQLLPGLDGTCSLMTMRILAVIAGLLALYVAGFLLFVGTLPSRPEQQPMADGIVVLTGGDARLDAAVALLEGGAGKRLLISGVNRTSTKAELKLL